MASGQQLAEQNVQTFASWIASKTDDDFRAMAVDADPILTTCAD
jgi:hypothetical protein